MIPRLNSPLCPRTQLRRTKPRASFCRTANIARFKDIRSLLLCTRNLHKMCVFSFSSCFFAYRFRLSWVRWWLCYDYSNVCLLQIIAYLLISASSSATIRIDDWQLNWGKDKFPDLATASVSMSFLAFVALASTSLISGYALCASRTA